MRKSFLECLAFIMLCLWFSHEATAQISGETVVIEETVNTDVTSSYLIVKSLTLTPKSNGDPLIISATNGNWSAKMIEQTSNVPPSMDKNFVRTEVAREEFTDELEFAGATPAGKQTAFGYSDELGRSTQSVLVSESPAANDIIAFHRYDPLTGLETHNYLPFTDESQNPGAFIENEITAQESFYTGTYGILTESKPHSITEYEDSPLRRVEAVTGVGAAWHKNGSNAVKANYDYFFNDGSTSTGERIRRWSISTNSNKEDQLPVLNGNYGQGDLTIVQVTDEQGHISQSCKDPRGLEVAKRVKKGTSWVVTYYVYDLFGRLRFILPPNVGVDDSQSDWTDKIEGYAFCYIYDERGRLIKERGPGVDWTYYAYDRWDRLVLSQTPRERKTNLWYFTKYDSKNRPIVSGHYTSSSSHASIQNSCMGSVNRYENAASGTSGYTSNRCFPTVNLSILSATYYDDYTFRSRISLTNSRYDFVNPSGFGSNVQNTAIKGQTTGSKTKVLTESGSAVWLHTVVYYDKYYQTIQIIADNHLGGYDEINTTYSIAGEVVKNQLDHRKTNTEDPLTYLQEYDYDDAGRLLKTWSKIGTGDKTLVGDYHYNELGQLIEKNLHSVNGSSFLQSIDYRYNVRGALASINNIAFDDDGITNDDTNDLFGANYHYTTNQTVDGLPIDARYDGMLAAFEWRNANIPGVSFDQSIFGYKYDDLNQLTKAKYGTGGNTWTSKGGHYDVNVTYDDDQGNIKTINRKSNGSTTPLDDLTYTYQTDNNKLDRVVDAGNDNQGFKDQTQGLGIYFYDTETGDLTGDTNKEITFIEYNHLNRVKSITFDDGTKITNLYDAAGNMLTKTVSDANGNTLSKVDYLGAIEYVDDEVHQIYTDEGRAYAQNGSFHYEYMIKDHQENNRVTFGYLPYRKEILATFEDSNLAKEREDFAISNSYLTPQILNNSPPIVNHTPLGTQMVALQGGNAAHEVGPATVLNISNGDRVDLEVWARYYNPLPPSSVTTFASLVESAFTSTSISSTAEGLSAINSRISAGGTGIFSASSTANETTAYMQWIFFDQSYNTITSGDMTNYVAVGSDSEGKYAKLSKTITFDRPGFLYIFLANETSNSEPVYFDDFKVVHESPTMSFQVTQVTDYYPYGMPMATSYKDDSFISAGLMYQSSFATYDSIAGTYDFLLRNYDPALGRFSAVDPYSQFASPYAGMGNMPHVGVDPDGGFAFIFGNLAYDLVAAGLVGGVAGGFYAKSQGESFNKGFGYGFLAGMALYGGAQGLSALSWGDIGSGLGNIFSGADQILASSNTSPVVQRALQFTPYLNEGVTGGLGAINVPLRFFDPSTLLVPRPAPATNISRQGVEMIASFEGFRANAYNDVAGLPTIGFGHLIQPGETFPNRLTRQQALDLLHQDVQFAVNAVNRYIDVPLTQNQFDALTSFTYNVGPGGLRNSTLRRLVNQGNMTDAEIMDAYLRYNRATINGVRQEVRGLTYRRVMEGNLHTQRVVR